MGIFTNRNSKPFVIQGEKYSDSRGELSFINDLLLKDIKRFYTIKHFDSKIIRGWQGHRKETKYFFPLEGAFVIGVIETPRWGLTKEITFSDKYYLSAESPRILIIPGGLIFGIKAMKDISQLLVLSNKTLKQSKRDDYRWNYEYFAFDWNEK